MYCLVMLAMPCGMVAEKRSMLRVGGTAARISLMLSVKPMLSISSASSMMTLRMPFRSTVFRFIRSSRRPGVATTTWTPRFRVLIWLSMLEPP